MGPYERQQWKKLLTGTTLRQVRKRLESEFEKLNTKGGQNAIRDMIDHVDKVISKFMATILQEKEEYLTESDISAVDSSSSEFPEDYRISEGDLPLSIWN